MTKESQSTYPLRLPRSVKAEVERRAKAVEGSCQSAMSGSGY
jgi:hypothetical protein